MTRIRLSASIRGSSILLKSKIVEFMTPMPFFKLLLPKTRHEQRIELMAMPDGKLMATLSGDIEGQCLYERRGK